VVHFKIIGSLSACILFLMMSGCSTRQVAEQFNGSTEQRLVTHSVDQLMRSLPQEPLNLLTQKKVFLQSHFIKEGVLLDYATSRLKAEISQRYHSSWVASPKISDYVIDVFFTSLGTDQDSFGLSIPLPVQGEGTEPAKIPILSFDMFHGISEMYLYLTETATNNIVLLPTQKKELRTDKISTPIITIPVSSVD